jgi:hypothetical protein
MAEQNLDLDSQNVCSIASFFVSQAYNDIFRRKFHFALAFCSVYLVVVCTLVVN